MVLGIPCITNAHKYSFRVFVFPSQVLPSEMLACRACCSYLELASA